MKKFPRNELFCSCEDLSSHEFQCLILSLDVQFKIMETLHSIDSILNTTKALLPHHRVFYRKHLDFWHESYGRVPSNKGND